MSFDDLLGDEEKPRNLGGRPKGSKTVNRRTPLPISLKTGDVHTVTTGVSIPWLARVFRMGRAKIEEALHECKPLRTTQNGGAIYDLPTAAAFLVAPKTNLDAYLRTIKPNQLPDHLRGGYWDAKTKEAKFRVMAGDLWPTEAIIETLGETFKTLKSTIQLWADTIEETKGLTDDQRALLSEMTDRLMDEMRTALVEQAKNNMTESWLSTIDDAAQEG